MGACNDGLWLALLSWGPILLQLYGYWYFQFALFLCQWLCSLCIAQSCLPERSRHQWIWIRWLHPCVQHLACCAGHAPWGWTLDLSALLWFILAWYCFSLCYSGGALDCHEGLGSPQEHYKVEARALNHAHQLASCLDLCHWCRTHLPWHFQLLHWLCLAPHGLFRNFLLGLDVWLEEPIASLGPAMVFTYVFMNFGSIIIACALLWTQKQQCHVGRICRTHHVIHCGNCCHILSP